MRCALFFGLLLVANAAYGESEKHGLVQVSCEVATAGKAVAKPVVTAAVGHPATIVTTQADADGVSTTLEVTINLVPEPGGDKLTVAGYVELRRGDAAPTKQALPSPSVVPGQFSSTIAAEKAGPEFRLSCQTRAASPRPSRADP